MLSIFRGIRTHASLFSELVRILVRNRELTLEMAKREILDRFVGQTLGVFWAFGHPLVLIMVYIFVFVVVFKVKIGGTAEMPLDYSTYLLSGLVPWLCFQESMSKGSIAIIANANLVKQVVFPIEILPVKSAVSSLITLIVYLLILIGYVLVSHHSLLWTYSLLPVLFFFQALTMIGINYILSAVGVYFRDIKDFVQVFAISGIYLVPICYLPDFVPEIFRPLLYVNPFSYYIWVYQDALYFGRFVHWWAWIVVAVNSLIWFYVGYLIFRKLKVAFGSVL